MKRTVITLTLTALTALFISAPMFAAGTASGNIAVSASVSQVCSMTVPNLAFGAYDVFGSAVTKTGTIVVACTKGATSVRLDLDAGANGTSAVGTTRAMQDGTTGNFLNYELYNGATVWGTGAATGGVTLTGLTKAGTSYTLTGTIPAGQDANVGTGYADTVTATLNY